jgi:hypothetical protein
VLVVVNPLPDPPGAIIGPLEVCAGDENVLYHVDPALNAEYYYWDLGEGIFGSSDSSSILLSFADPFNFTGSSITVWSANDCGYSELSSSLIPVVNIPPLMPGTILGPDSLCTTTDTAVIYELQDAVPGAVNYEWKVIPEEAGSITGDGMSVQMNWVKNWEGEASIIVRALNDCGVSDWSGPKDIFTYTCVGISESSAGEISFILYPNPANESIYLELKPDYSPHFLDVLITDLYGRVFEQMRFDGDDTRISINTAAWPSGMYLIRITAGDHVHAVAKFVISH